MEPVASPFHRFAHPYRSLSPAEEPGALHGAPDDRRGSALIWHLGARPSSKETEFAGGRPPGVALVMILPPASDIDPPDHVLRAVELCRPHSILPHHRQLSVTDLRAILSRAPDDLPGEVTDYLGWRGLTIDMETRRLIRKTVELSAELSTVNGLARALYVSRRALGRRFTSRGLPVPSHWLHFARVLRAAMRLQDSEDTLLTAAARLGYPDGFALSNQMHRLVGVRPVVAREHLGWEWLLEEWLLREALGGGLSKEIISRILASPNRDQVAPRSPKAPPSTLAPPFRSDARVARRTPRAGR